MTSSGDVEARAQLIDSPAAPTVGQMAVRSIPTVLVAVAGPPLVAVVMPGGAGDGWWFLAVFSLFVLAGLVQYLVQPSQPRLDKGVSQERWKWALSSVTKTRAVPVDPGVRANAAAVACTEIQMFVVLISFILGVVLGLLIRPEAPWSSFLGAPIGMALVSAFRLRRSLTYLKVLHAQARTDGQQSQRQ
ncbi:hypothetical protein ACT4S2_09210 [Kocuria turfanensis]|uniref:hypothetical protein n=1 Tax=Kocuria turfanensis TaxID=388357 RepID=UPI0040374D9A